MAKVELVIGMKRKHYHSHWEWLHSHTLAEASWAPESGPNPIPHLTERTFDKEDFRAWCPLFLLPSISSSVRGRGRLWNGLTTFTVFDRTHRLHRYKHTQKIKTLRGMVSKSLELLVLDDLNPLKKIHYSSFTLGKKVKKFSETPNKTWRQFSALQREWIRIAVMGNWLLSAGWQELNTLFGRGAWNFFESQSSFLIGVSLLERLLLRARWHPNGNKKYWMELKSSKSSRGSGWNVEQIRGNHKEMSQQRKKIVRRALPAALTAVLCRMFFQFSSGGMWILILRN